MVPSRQARRTTTAREPSYAWRQKFTRVQLFEGTPHTIHTEVTQRETWTRTPDGWNLLFVDEVRDPITIADGRRDK